MDKELYIHSKWDTEYVVTRYRADMPPQEYYLQKNKILGPVQFDDENEKDWIFGLEGIEGIFVASKKETLLTPLYHA